MSNHGNELIELLGLDALHAGSMNYPDFLQVLKEHPEYADTAAGSLVRAVKSKGLVDLTKTAPERIPYLEMLQMMRIPAYKAFDHVRGSQRVVAGIMKHFEAAAGNGYQLRQMLTLIGGPGSGKSFLVDALAAVLEGQIVYTVAGCPLHENPLNLLRLLKQEQLEKLAAHLGPHINELMKATLEPCAHCFRQLMFDGETPRETPNLSNITVNALRLSSRNAGVSVWSPSTQGNSLKTALQDGSRGLVRLVEAFSAKGIKPGEVSELQILLEATEGRRIPGGVSDGHSNEAKSYSPFDGVIVAETNKGSWDAFIAAQPDPDAFTRRNRIMTVTYNTVRTEEVQAYTDFMKNLHAVPHMDPLALKVAATLAVASRMGDDTSVEPDLITRMRMYEGERISVTKKPAPTPYGGGYGTYGSQPKPADAEKVNVSDLWKAAGEQEGTYGLNMGFMLSFISQVVDVGLTMGPPHKPKCVSALTMLNFLRQRIGSWAQTAKTVGVTKQEEKVIERCLSYLKEIESLSSTPALVEKEYRRLLRAQLLQVFAPTYEQRAAEDFDTYVLHARAFAGGKSKVFDPRHRAEIDVNVKFLDEMDSAQGLYSREDRERFRGSVDAKFNQIVRAQAQQAGEEEANQIVIDWRTIPELAKAISSKLDAEIAKKVERILTVQVADLAEDEKKLRSESMQRFRDLGYCDVCLEQALNYSKDHKLWISQS